MSRARSRARKRAFQAKGWAEQRKTINGIDNRATRAGHAPKPKPEWVAQVESSGYQTIGGDRWGARATGLTREQRQSNRVDRCKRPAAQNPHTDYVRQTRPDGRARLMAGTFGLRGARPKLLKLPLGTVVRSSLRPEYRKPRATPSPYAR